MKKIALLALSFPCIATFVVLWKELGFSLIVGILLNLTIIS
jgi:general stress protein CsbA